eukprot:6593960-Prymnesium_polylepis.1
MARRSPRNLASAAPGAGDAPAAHWRLPRNIMDAVTLCHVIGSPSKFSPDRYDSFWPRGIDSSGRSLSQWPMAYDAPCGGIGRYARPA